LLFLPAEACHLWLVQKRGRASSPGWTRLDRLARSTRDRLDILDMISQRGALRSNRCGIVGPIPRNASGRLMITILAGLAEFERELIRFRCGEGIERAKQRGVRFGRPKKLIAHQRQEALQRLEEGATQADVDFSEATISRLVARPFGGAQEEGLAA